MDLLYLVVVLIVVVILIIVLFKVLDHLMILPAVYATISEPLVEKTLDTGPAQIVINQSNSTDCFRAK